MIHSTGFVIGVVLSLFCTEMSATFPIASTMIHSKKMILDVIKDCTDVDTLDRTQKFMVFCNVCDNLLEDGRITKANHKKWTEIV